ALTAGWAAAFGWGEVSLHLLTLLFALIAIAAFFSIRNDLLGAALLASSPAFFISTQSVMPDMLMLALLLTCVAAALRYRDDGRFAPLAFRAVLRVPIATYTRVIAVCVLATIAIRAPERPERRPRSAPA